MVGFWFNEAELTAFDNALKRANYVKPNGTANRADYLKDMAAAIVEKCGSGVDKKAFAAPKPKASKPKASKPKASKPKASKPKASKPKASKPKAEARTEAPAPAAVAVEVESGALPS